jgi:DNA primase
MKQGVSKLPIQVSNPDKLFWPEEGYTKLALIEFYSGIFPKLRPYVDVDSSRKATNYVVGGSLKTQLALVNLGCIAVHVSGSRTKTMLSMLNVEGSRSGRTSGQYRVDALPQ